MKIKSLFIALLLTLGLTANAANEKKTVAQVTDAVELTENVDYIITGTDPFATTGSINISNTEHAVIILQNIRPSKVTDAILSHIYINGEPAVKGDLTSANSIKGSNCQVKMYNRGAIIMPYAQDFKPLTVYSEQNFGGDSYNNYTEGHEGGYMKTLNATTFNNKIRSFKLKRGYMVTFAVGTGGWGYSRCFIADNEDLEVATLPGILDQKISSYRLFKWWDASKAGIHDTSAACNSALKTTSCFDWAQGNANLLPDVEWVPNHIYEDWPSSATCGSVTGSCHMKTNNEPGNSADDHPQDVETVLNNWENLMRTGMRLCSESSHDGSMQHLKNFIEEIDKRGWRCDILDLHCYWTGQFNNIDWYRSEYGKGRPIWISEWVYGSSWGNAGIFNNPPDGRDSYSTKNQQKNYEYVKPVLDMLNSKDYIERYFYWNSEADCSKIYKNGEISIIGKYFAQMETGLAYKKKNEYIPKETALEAPSDPTATYAKATSTKPATVKIEWTDPNGDLMTTLAVQCKLPGSSTWTTVGEVEAKDKSSKSGASYSFTYEPEEPGTYTFRVKETSYNNKSFTTGETAVNVAPAQGTSSIQFGRLTLDNTNPLETSFSETMTTAPAVFIGTITNKNSKFEFGNYMSAATNSKFTYQTLPWKSNTGSLDKAEEVPFLAIVPGSYKFGNMYCEVGTVKNEKATSNTWSDTTCVEFEQAFPEDVTPVVITEIKKPGYNTKTTLGVRVFDVTNTGFKFIVYSEEKSGQKVLLAQNVNYIAVTPGFEVADEEMGIYIAAGHGDSQIYGSAVRGNYFTVNNGEEVDTLKLYNPTILTGLQTNNYPTLSTLRRTDITSKDEDGIVWTSGTNVKRVLDAVVKDENGKDIPQTNTNDAYAAYRDNLGWVTISLHKDGGSVPKHSEEVSISNVNTANSNSQAIYDINGARVKAVVPNRIYIVNGKKVIFK